MTYQSLTSLVKKNPGMRDFMRTHFDVVIEDEAHRGLGMKTKIAKDSLMLTPEETSEVEAENVLGIGAK